MKKSKLTGTLAVGGGLKYAVVPYIITGEENNGYSKGDILDANYVKQLINNATPNDISADTLTLHSGTISTDNGFGVSSSPGIILVTRVANAPTSGKNNIVVNILNKR